MRDVNGGQVRLSAGGGITRDRNYLQKVLHARDGINTELYTYGDGPIYGIKTRLSLGEEYITYPDGLAGCVQDERQPKHGGGKAYEHSAKGYSLQLHWLSKNKTKVRVGRCPP